MQYLLHSYTNTRQISKILPKKDIVNNQRSDLFFLSFDNYY
jgi:hypothetical protein